MSSVMVSATCRCVLSGIDVSCVVVISNRLVTSSCAVVADQMGYTGNIERMMSACITNSGQRRSDKMTVD